MIFITGMLAQKESLHEVVKRCKQLGKMIVLGGPYVTSTIEELPYADHIFQGEAETTLPQFFEDLERGETKRIYKAPERPPLSIIAGSRLWSRRSQEIQLHVGAVLAWLSILLRVLRHHRDLRTCAAHQEQPTDARRV